MSNPKDKKDIDYGWENDLITDDEIKDHVATLFKQDDQRQEERRKPEKV